MPLSRQSLRQLPIISVIFRPFNKCGQMLAAPRAKPAPLFPTSFRHSVAIGGQVSHQIFAIIFPPLAGRIMYKHLPSVYTAVQSAQRPVYSNAATCGAVLRPQTEARMVFTKRIPIKMIEWNYTKKQLAALLHMSLASLYNRLNDPDIFTYKNCKLVSLLEIHT